MLANYSRIPLDTSRRTAIQDAHQSESKSIECLKQLVVFSAEVFNLWKLLSEHQFHIIAKELIDVSKKYKNYLVFIIFDSEETLETYE
jgi:nuclear pore complex protein Nup155